jgi:lipopolysaccharide transport system ATP-binding protein
MDHIMKSDIAVHVQNLSKCYQIYDNPNARLKQFLVPKVKRLFGKKQHPYYREFWSLQDISFEIKRGETVGIIGRNGSGKSTLLQIICGTLAPSGGSVQVNGRVAALLELGSGFNPEFTGRENVYLNAAILGLTQEEIDNRFHEIEEFADIGEFIEQPVKSYSSGMMLRLAFAVIAHVDADILIVDEALAVGDAFFTQKCMRFLRSFMKHGTILFVSHDTASIKNLCNRAIWLDKGKLIQAGHPKEVCELYLVDYYEEQQGASKESRSQQIIRLPDYSKTSDQRLKFINASNLRNDLQIFKFKTDSKSFGTGGVTIGDVCLLDETGNPLSWVVGGEKVSLQILADIHCDLNSPIAGFWVNDRLGQIIFGDNTCITYYEKSVPCLAGTVLKATFVFNMPMLPVGDYSIMVSIANGNQEDHVQHHWIHDAILFKAESSSVALGLMGVPMIDINITQQ